MAGKREAQMERVEHLLEVVDRLKENAVIYSSAIYRRDIQKKVSEFFHNRKLIVIDEFEMIKEEIDKVFVKSLEEGTPLFTSLSVKTSPFIMQRLGQILEDGYFEMLSSGGLKKVTPCNGWYAIVLCDSSAKTSRSFPIADLFSYTLAL